MVAPPCRFSGGSATIHHVPGAGGTENRGGLDARRRFGGGSATIHHVPGAGGTENRGGLDARRRFGGGSATIHRVPGAGGTENRGGRRRRRRRLGRPIRLFSYVLRPRIARCLLSSHNFHAAFLLRPVTRLDSCRCRLLSSDNFFHAAIMLLRRKGQPSEPHGQHEENTRAHLPDCGAGLLNFPDL